jgi:hypothetical protein
MCRVHVLGLSGSSGGAHAACVLISGASMPASLTVLL